MRDWEHYFEATDADRPLRPLFVDALAAYPTGDGLTAVDLGYGHGVETHALLNAGFAVYAVDGAAHARDRLIQRVAGEENRRLTTVVADLVDADPPPCDLIWAGFSLFFVPANQFVPMWTRLRKAVRPGGGFAGQLLGARDTWAGDADTAAFTRDQALALFDGWSIDHVEEVDEDGRAVTGPKHWHLFHVIAHRPSDAPPDGSPSDHPSRAASSRHPRNG